MNGLFTRNSLSKAVRVLFISFAFIFLVEASLRLIFGLGTPVLILPDKGEAEQGYGYIPAPDQDVRRFFAHNKINHFSMRSDDISPTKTNNHVRVYFIGDSVTYGTTYIDQLSIFTTLVSRELPGRVGHAVDALNASAGGWAPGNEVGFLRKKGTFDSDLVLIVLNTADLDQPFSDFQPNPGFPTAAPWTAIGEAWTRYIAPRFLGAQGVAPDPGSIAVAPSTVDQKKAVLVTLEQGRTYAISHNALFGIVYIPSHGKVWDGADFQMAKTMLIDWASKNSVPLIDLEHSFEGHSLDELYLERGDGRIHLSAAAHRIVATRLIDVLPAILNPSAPASQNLAGH